MWQSAGDAYHLLFVIYDMLNEFTSKPQLVPAYERSVSLSLLHELSPYFITQKSLLSPACRLLISNVTVRLCDRMYKMASVCFLIVS